MSVQAPIKDTAINMSVLLMGAGLVVVVIIVLIIVIALLHH
jgi:hypothetical protein